MLQGTTKGRKSPKQTLEALLPEIQVILDKYYIYNDAKFVWSPYDCHQLKKTCYVTIQKSEELQDLLTNPHESTVKSVWVNNQWLPALTEIEALLATKFDIVICWGKHFRRLTLKTDSQCNS